MIPISLGRVLVEPFDWLSVSQGRPVYQSVCPSILQSVSQSVNWQRHRQSDRQSNQIIAPNAVDNCHRVSPYLPFYWVSRSFCLFACPSLCLSVSLSLCHSGICNNIIWALEPNCLRPADPFAFLSGWSSNQAHFCSFTFPFWQIHWPYIRTIYLVFGICSICMRLSLAIWSLSLSPWVWTQHFEIISGA